MKCPKLKSPLNGMMNASGFSFKDDVLFTCLPGYIMNGVARIWCRSTGLWTMDPPICERKLIFCLFKCCIQKRSTMVFNRMMGLSSARQT